jgi:hypothetical protein
MPHRDFVQELMDHGVNRVASWSIIYQTRSIHLSTLFVEADMKPSRLQLDRWYRGHATREGTRSG